MKAKKATHKELTTRILEKISEALEGVDQKAVRKIRRSAENTASKLAKKFTATLDKIAQKENTASKKQKKKTKKSETKLHGKASKLRKTKASKAESSQATTKPSKNIPAPDQA
jgi:Zn-dependent M16 (insulinase) family peptidase